MAKLVQDNPDLSGDIFLMRDNGEEVYTVKADGSACAYIYVLEVENDLPRYFSRRPVAEQAAARWIVEYGEATGMPPSQIQEMGLAQITRAPLEIDLSS